MTEIDTKCWINSRKEPLINATRMAHGDIDAKVVDGVISSAVVVNNTIANRLVSARIISESDYYDAMVFMDLRRAYEASQGVKWRSIDSSMLNALGIAAGDANSYYDRIKHELGLPHGIDTIRNVVRAMTSECRGYVSFSDAEKYKEAFAKLIKAMMEVSKRHRESQNVVA